MTTKIGPGGGPFRLAGRFGLGLLVAGLVACGQGQPEAPDTEVVTDWVQPTAELPVREQDLPLGQLGEAVIPVREERLDGAGAVASHLLLAHPLARGDATLDVD